VIRSDIREVLIRKATVKAAEWDAMWESRVEKEKAARQREQERYSALEAKEAKKQEAEERTDEAEKNLDALNRILQDTLPVNDTIDWDSLKDFSDYPKPRPSLALSTSPSEWSSSEKPRRADPKYDPRISLIDRLLGRFFKTVIAKRHKEAEQRFITDHVNWEMSAREGYERHKRSQDDYRATVRRLKQEHDIAIQTWENERNEYLARRDKANAAIEEEKAPVSGRRCGRRLRLL
jgi:restriction system protein